MARQATTARNSNRLRRAESTCRIPRSRWTVYDRPCQIAFRRWPQFGMNEAPRNARHPSEEDGGQSSSPFTSVLLRSNICHRITFGVSPVKRRLPCQVGLICISCRSGDKSQCRRWIFDEKLQELLARSILNRQSELSGITNMGLMDCGQTRVVHLLIVEYLTQLPRQGIHDCKKDVLQ